MKLEQGGMGLHSGIYGFTVDQKELMAGLGIQGSKIKRLD
jgi:hypothetical protein